MKNCVVFALAAAAAGASAQVSLTGGTYYQNFDTLQLSGTGYAWVNNLPAPGMQGWYSSQTTYDADGGFATTSGQYSYGGSAAERALGSLALPGALIAYGAQLNNASGSTFTQLNVDYHGEQWRDGSAPSADVLSFQYSTNATSMLTGTWTSFTSLDFNSVSNVGAGPLNGNLLANEAFMNQTITGLNWANGTDLWIRWLHVGNGSRHGMAIDDVHLTGSPVPEPFTLSGLGIACIGLLRRRARRS